MFSDPLTHPWHFTGLEVVFLACFLLTVRDVAARWRRGERYALFQWLVVLAYGVAMELVAFAAYPDYEHGRFTVQLVGGKLPLYVTFVYVVFHYTGLKLVERLGMKPLPEAVAAGLCVALVDVPFDLVGADARWWIWHPSSHDVAQRWLGVPLTSYEWYLLFAAVLVGACRLLRPRIEGRSLAAYAGLAPLVALGVIIIGVITFLPFHALEALGVPDGAIVAAHAGAALWVALRARASTPSRPPARLVAVVVLLAAWHALVLAVLWMRGEIADGPAKAAVVACGVATLFVVFVRDLPIRGRSASRLPRPAPAGSRTSS